LYQKLDGRPRPTENTERLSSTNHGCGPERRTELSTWIHRCCDRVSLAGL
jgi:hypothetical protein